MANTNDEVSTYTVFVGTSTEGASEGLYSLRLEAGLGRLSLLETIPSKDNPTFLAVDQECRRLYSADRPGRDGLVKAWSIDP
ncbi:MAG TPA: beta-propeller fold lactonase family protein, partial [Firmicutes bacterium]|nr:beta-propeller fold lactonase family protein [Bacillota bacterium]